ncbi:hypothetical protein GGF32_005865 [Allomyces javanicus]|nr:hypothetical protein GGF32_005865 [Allomyces javanicus]
MVWKFELRRDDNEPAPWTDEGKAYIKEHHLAMVMAQGPGRTFSCGICEASLIDPITPVVCGHSVCRACAEETPGAKEVCGTCKVAIGEWAENKEFLAVLKLIKQEYLW